MSSSIKSFYMKAHMKATTPYWLLLVLQAVVEFSLICNAVRVPRWNVHFRGLVSVRA